MINYGGGWSKPWKLQCLYHRLYLVRPHLITSWYSKNDCLIFLIWFQTIIHFNYNWCLHGISCHYSNSVCAKQYVSCVIDVTYKTTWLFTYMCDGFDSWCYHRQILKVIYSPPNMEKIFFDDDKWFSVITIYTDR